MFTTNTRSECWWVCCNAVNLNYDRTSFRVVNHKSMICLVLAFRVAQQFLGVSDCRQRDITCIKIHIDQILILPALYWKNRPRQNVLRDNFVKYVKVCFGFSAQVPIIFYIFFFCFQYISNKGPKHTGPFTNRPFLSYLWQLLDAFTQLSRAVGTHTKKSPCQSLGTFQVQSGTVTVSLQTPI